MSLFGLFGENKNASVLGVDIGSSSLKVVQLRREKGVAVLETYGELALGPYGGVEVGQATNLSGEKIAETLADLLREAKVTTKSAGVSIPFSRSLLTLVELPRREDPNEQRTIIELEARKYIPVPVQEVQLDWFILPDAVAEDAKKSSKVRVLLVAVHNDELSLLQNAANGAGIETSFFELEIFSTIRSVVNEPVRPILVLDIGASATKSYVVERGIVALSHNIPRGGQDVTRTIASAYDYPIARAEALKKQYGFAVPAKDAYDRKTIELVFSSIFDEARRVITQYETGQKKSIAGIVLTGGGGVTKALSEYAATFFSIPVTLADPFGKTQAPAFMRPVLAEIGPEFAVAVGIALRKLQES